MKNCEEILKKYDKFHDNFTENLNVLLLERITSKIYKKIYPKTHSKKDLEFFNILRIFQWFSYDNLHISSINFTDNLWDLAIKGFFSN